MEPGPNTPENVLIELAVQSDAEDDDEEEEQRYEVSGRE